LCNIDVGSERTDEKKSTKTKFNLRRKIGK